MVTGASRGIGRGIALDLAQRGYGLTITSRTGPDLTDLAVQLREAGARRVVYHPADLADRDGLPVLAQLHRDTFATMDALILCGGVGTAGPLGTLSTHRVDKTLQVNFVAALSLIQHALPQLRAAAAANPQRGARVIALASSTGVYTGRGLAVYGASKAALISLAGALNAEESGHGVMATAIAPGFVDTDMSSWITGSIPAETMIPVDDIVAVVRMLLDLGRTTSITKIVLSRSGTTGYTA